MVYFTSRHSSTEQNCDKNNNSKDEKQPLLCYESRSHYDSLSTKLAKSMSCYSSSCTTPTDGLDPLVPPLKRLTHLRRMTWSSSHNGFSPSPTNEQLYDDPPIPIRLPSDSYLTNSNDDNDAVRNELQRLVSWTVAACLVCPIGATAIVFLSSPSSNSSSYVWMQQSFQPLLAVFWCLLAVFWKHHPEHLCPFSQWAQAACIVALLSLWPIPTLFQTTAFSWLFFCMVGVHSIGVCLFVVARRLDRAGERQRLGYRQRMRDQHSLAQRLINEQTYTYAQRRLAFLSTISNEIQDAALMIITTLEQFSPAAILHSNSTQELLSACSIAVPITSISAIHTTIKQVCHISSHLQLMSCLVQETNSSKDGACGSSSTTAAAPLLSHLRQSFDIGELTQSAGDALAGMASKLDVNMVLYHSDNSLHHTRIIADEAAFRHAILSLIRNILEGSTPGACIELGLNLTPVENDKKKVTVTFEITHTCSPAIPKHLTSASILLPTSDLTTQLIRYIGGRLTINPLTARRIRFEMAVEVELGDTGDDDDHMLFIEETGAASPLHKSYRHIKFASEPTMKELAKFMENLKGLKMVLHANEQSVFAKHLTGCLASWNSDISHVPVTSLDDDNDTAAAAAMINSETCSTPGSEVDYNSSSALTDSVVDYQHHHRHSRQHKHTTTATSISSTASSLRSAPATTTTATATAATATTANAPHVPSPATEEEHILSIPPTFVLIDDHIMTLEHKLLEFRTHPPASALPAHGRRHKHSKKNQSSPSHHHHQGAATAIIHFTSLNNYKRVRDTIQWASTLSTPFAMPRIVVVPKPAGPRRYLTALHTVWHNAMVEPHFIPIATSPSSPVPTVLLSSMLSQIVDPSSSVTPPDPTVSHHHHLHPHHPHRPRRPVSGMFSPSFIQMQLQQHEGSNYFVDWPGSPFHRRRSFNELDSAHHSDGGDHPVTTPTPTPTATALDHSPRSTGVQDESKVPIEPETPTASVPVDSPPCTDQGHNKEVSNPSVSKTAGTPSPSSTDPSSSVTTTAQSDATKPRLANNIKINKRKKKEKRSPFANVVSPPINVLIVEDNMINQAILSAWMKKHKIKFSVASNGQEAVEKWKGGGFHLILMDIQLPVMSGIDATKTIRSIEKEQKIGVLPMSSSFLRQRQRQQNNDEAESPTVMVSSSASSINSASSPTNDSSGSHFHPGAAPSTFRSPVIIVALTASSLESDRHAALAAGCNDFLTKPVSLEWLEKKIIEWGCMQALIDFEGWRIWKRSTHDEDVSSWANKVNQQGGSTTPSALTLDMGTSSFSGQDSPSPLPAPGIPNSTSNNSSSSITSGVGAERKGILLPGAIGWNKRRFSTVEKQHGLRRHNTTSANHHHHTQTKYSPTSITRTASFSRFPIQKSYSASTAPAIRRQTTKKAASMDDTMQSAEVD